MGALSISAKFYQVRLPELDIYYLFWKTFNLISNVNGYICIYVNIWMLNIVYDTFVTIHIYTVFVALLTRLLSWSPCTLKFLVNLSSKIFFKLCILLLILAHKRKARTQDSQALCKSKMKTYLSMKVKLILNYASIHSKH